MTTIQEMAVMLGLSTEGASMTYLGLYSTGCLATPTPLGVKIKQPNNENRYINDPIIRGKLLRMMSDADMMLPNIKEKVAVILNAATSVKHSNVKIKVEGERLIVKTTWGLYRINMVTLNVTVKRGDAWIIQEYRPAYKNAIHKLQGILCQVGMM